MHMLGGKSPAEQIEAIEHVFVAAAMRHHDTGACSDFRLIMFAMSDMELLQYTKQNTRGELELLDDKHGETVIRDTEYRAAIACAMKAMELFPKIPNERRGWSPNESDKSTYPTLLETKKAMLAEIGNGATVARSDEEADPFLEFILFTPLRYDEEEPLRQATVKKMTDEHFPVPRLVHAIATFGEKLANSEKGRRVLEILLFGWAKHAYSNDIVNACRVLEPLSGPPTGFLSSSTACSDAAVERLRAINAKMKQLDDAVRALLEKTGLLYDKDTTVEYSDDLGTVNVRKAEVIRDQNTGDFSFNNHANRIREWLAANRQPGMFRVHFFYVGGREPWYHDKEPIVVLDKVL
jgi:hypothetical protein